MTLVQFGAGFLLAQSVVLAIYSLLKMHRVDPCRSKRPLVLPVFAATAYAIMRVSWILAAHDARPADLQDVAWFIVDTSLLASVWLLISGYCEHRAAEGAKRPGYVCRTHCEEPAKR